MSMNAASLSSPRLQRVLTLLSDGRSHSTRSIMRKARVCAISACVSELREHGAEIVCERKRVGDDWRFFYTMLTAPGEAEPDGVDPLNFEETP